MTGGRISLSSTVPKLAIVAAAAVAIILGAAASARATTEVSVSYDGHLRGLATFRDIGDWFEICDERADNLPVAVRYSYIRKDDSTQRGTHWHKVGKDGFGPSQNGLALEGCSFFNHDFAEDRRVWFQACVGHPGGTLTCGKTEVTVAGPSFPR
jgi:hypothetical protein